MITKTKMLQGLLIGGGLYYVIGAIAHFFGLTIFPFYDSHLYTQYHDTVIALVAINLSILFFVTARNPIKNIDTVNVIIAGAIIAIIFSIGIIWKIDFTKLGAPDKKTQTIVEMIMLIVYVILLVYLKPKQKKEKISADFGRK